MKKALRLAPLVLGLLLLASAALAQPAALKLPPPGKTDKCPVCGMFVAKYKDWLAYAVLTDGKLLYFDGPKDMFRFVADPGHYLSGFKKEQIAELYVSEFYSLKPILAQDAFYVAGSDAYGPMGHELVPLATQADAEAFRKDHKGKRVLRYGDITPALLKALD
ncbi:nitrous oxide reductase accessory protein NosL [Fundidesulfovibrio agrisoli]|uniref:nitrous oxide reductase accessory protein NosL n=1 Tax=Fundidesulfovibrio agrisoli TaxID=2922717 RepID=UPI001FAD68D0|nr:nitrous oxide reductase accessory protein NosL [Fundidesulfovibrio agrisoli]